MGDRLAEVVRVMPFLRDLGREMSRPIPADRREVQCIPTQYLCEWIKSQKYDGVAYESGVAKGWNVALFDATIAKGNAPKRRAVQSVAVSLDDTAE